MKNVLETLKRFELMKHVQANYTTTGETDEKFASGATTLFGFPVTRSNVHGCRTALGIESTIEANARRRAAPQTRFEHVEARLAKLENWIKKSFGENSL